MGAGGLSNVSVCKGSVPGEDDKVEYLICGRRITDHSVSFRNASLLLILFYSLFVSLIEDYLYIFFCYNWYVLFRSGKFLLGLAKTTY